MVRALNQNLLAIGSDSVIWVVVGGMSEACCSNMVLFEDWCTILSMTINSALSCH